MVYAVGVHFNKFNIMNATLLAAGQSLEYNNGVITCHDDYKSVTYGFVVPEYREFFESGLQIANDLYSKADFNRMTDVIRAISQFVTHAR